MDKIKNKWKRNNIKDATVKKIDGTKESEIVVSDLETTNEILNQMGYFSRSYQENDRIRYILDDVELDIDSWPMIPTYLEIEGKDEKSVLDMIEKLGLNKEKVTALDVQSVYKDIYGIDISNMKELKF